MSFLSRYAFFRTGRKELLGLLIIFACTSWFYGYIGIPPVYPATFEKQNRDYYNLLTGGFLSGHLSLSTEPPPALVALADPYDPVQRAAAGDVGMHDVTYYKGRYYLYFGVAPALTLFVPFKALTGYYFPQNLATVLFCCGGYFWSLCLLVGLRRRFFPEAGTGWVWLGAFMLGLANFCPVMVVRNSVWEVPISCAYFYAMLGLWLVFRFLAAGPRRLVWLALASAAFGMMIGSRPHLIFGACALGTLWAVAWGLKWRRGGDFSTRDFTREAAAALLPVGVILAGLLIYNHARFGSYFEFGQKYQLAGSKVSDSQLLSLRFLPTNFYYYFLSPAHVERYFPFFQVIRGYPWGSPADYLGSENTYGLLVNQPFSWLAVFAPALWAWRFRQNRDLGVYLLVFGVFFAGITLVIMCFAGSASRYMVDFVPSLLLAAALGLFMLEELGRVSPGRRWLLTAAGWLPALATAVFSVLITFRHDVYRAHRSGDFAVMQKVFNQPAFWWEKSHPIPYGPVEMTVRFPRDQFGHAEPLIVSGVSFLTDYLFIYYHPDTRHVQIRFNHQNYNELTSQLIPIDFGIPHRIEIDAGFLYPIATHPYYQGWATDRIESARRALEVRIDGVPYLLAQQNFFDPSPEHLTMGENRISGYIESRFTGEILDTKRNPLPETAQPLNGGQFLHLALMLPTGATGRREALLSTGEPGRQDSIFISYDAADRIRFGFLHDGDEPKFSSPVNVRPGEIQLVDASLGSRYPKPKNARERELAQRLVVRLNCQPAWTETTAFHPAASPIPVIGRATATSPTPLAAFSGRILAQQTVDLFAAAPDSPFSVAPYWIENATPAALGAMRLRLELPKATPNPREPLLVSGATTPTSDYIYLNYFPGEQGSLGFLHAGNDDLQAPRMRLDPGRPRLLEINLPSFYPSESADFFASRTLAEIAELKRTRLQVRLDGRTMFDSQTETYFSAPGQISIGADKFGQVRGSRFTGRVIAIERESLLPPPGLSANSGPLELTLMFPESAPAGNETLLATGTVGRRDTLFVSYEQSRRAHFTVRTAGGTELTSGSFAIDGSPHVLNLAWGGLNPGAPNEAQRTVKVSLDGKTLLDQKADFVLTVPQELTLGRAPAGSPAFSGWLKAVRRLP
ncbi:MAG: hypothetical protein RL324_684 [Verrucomicrobiota bacterium]|jgi:hypothetical protein